MSSNIVLPPLSLWTQDHIRAIYQATTQSETEAAFDAFFANDAQITINGTNVSRADYVNQAKSEKSQEGVGIVAFAGIVEVPSNEDQPILAGSVGVFYTATIEGTQDAPESTVTSSVNIVIEQDLEIPVPVTHPGTVGGGFDRRRVKVMNQVVY